MKARSPSTVEAVEAEIAAGIAAGIVVTDHQSDQDRERELAHRIDGFSSFHDADELADVDAAFRSQLRIAVAYFVVFAAGIIGAAVATSSSRWAVADRVLGGFSPSFLIAAVVVYIFVLVIGLAAATLANGVDDRMLGAGLTPASPLASAPVALGSSNAEGAGVPPGP